VTEVTTRNHVEQVMGTAVTFDLVTGDVPTPVVDQALESACALLHDVDDVFSVWQRDSPMSRLRRHEVEPADVPLEVGEVLLACETMRQMTGGWFDARRMPGGVDPTGYVKGWAAQRALFVLHEAGVPAALVNAGGDAVCFGWPQAHRPWRLGVRDPRSVGGLVGVVALEPVGDEPVALATSGTYERGEHLIDPATGAPARSDVTSASVLGPDLGVADALATALAAGGRACASVLDAPGYCGLLLHTDGSRTVIGNFRLLPMPSFAAAGIPPFAAVHPR
jgi:thiamine biosynthesis lipoprotein